MHNIKIDLTLLKAFVLTHVAVEFASFILTIVFVGRKILALVPEALFTAQKRKPVINATAAVWATHRDFKNTTE